jgi:hypothetical protein
VSRIAFLVFFFCMLISIASYANEIDYSNCTSIQEVIARETQEISVTHPADHDELAQLYVSRGESYLLDAQYDKAVEDFQNANFHIGYCRDVDAAKVVAFRTAFGEVVSYDNLGMAEQTQQALEQLKTIATHVVCNDCIEYHPYQVMVTPSANRLHFRDLVRPVVNKMHFRDIIVPCKHKKEGNQQSQQHQDNYDDILGPNQPPEPNWCEEVVVGVGRAMDAISCLAPNKAVRIALVGVIEALIQRGVKCCQAGGFWKACVAPITRKWREWKNNKEKNVLPNAQNLPFYIS